MDEQRKQEILKQLGGIPESMYDELVGELFHQMDDLIAKLEEALGKEDYQRIGEISHAIKGSSGNLRVNEVYELARGIEMAAKQNQDRQEIERQLKLLEQVCSQEGY